jgi:hypothetical protein
MKGIIIGALGAVLVSATAGAGLIHSGWVDVAADTPHHPLTSGLIEWARERSIERHIRDIVTPTDLADLERIRRGAGNYDAMCVGCHLAPGLADTEIRKGLYPQPPNLSRASPEVSKTADARRFWIIKHGIKASGMPAWKQGGMEDAAIWDLSAFVKTLPTLAPAQYRQLVAASDGHNHHGAMPDSVSPPAADKASRKSTAKPRAHNHADHQH